MIKRIPKIKAISKFYNCNIDKLKNLFIKSEDKLLVTTSRSLLYVDVKTQQTIQLHTGKGLYYGITSDKNFIYVGARNRLVSSKVNPVDEEGVILKFDYNLQLKEEIKASFPLRDIHQIRVIDNKLYIACSYDNMIAIYDGSNWEKWYPAEVEDKDINHFNSLYHDKKYIYIMAHNFGESEVYIFGLKNQKLIEKIKIGNCAHNIWKDKQNTIYTLSSEESKLIDTDNRSLLLEGFPRGIAITKDRLYIGISERAERKLRDFVDGKILIFNKEKTKIGELYLKSEGMVLDIRIINQLDYVSNEYIYIDENTIQQISTYKKTILQKNASLQEFEENDTNTKNTMQEYQNTKLNKSESNDSKAFEEKNQYDISDFTQYDDEAFITNVYMGILRRAPDSPGMQYYLNKLRSKLSSKVDIVKNIRFSKEGIFQNIKISGIKGAD